MISLLAIPVQWGEQQAPYGSGQVYGTPTYGPATESCPVTRGSPDVQVNAVRGEPTYSRAEDIASLTNKSAGETYRPEGTTGPAWHTQGLTQSVFQYEYNFPSVITRLGNGLYCLEVQSVDFTITLSPQVWVANEFPTGSCMYNAVKEHENKHVNVDRITTDRHLPQIRAALVEASRNRSLFGPTSEQQVKAQYDQFSHQVADIMKDEIDRLQDEDNRAQHQVDTLQEYQRVANECPGQRW